MKKGASPEEIGLLGDTRGRATPNAIADDADDRVDLNADSGSKMSRRARNTIVVALVVCALVFIGVKIAPGAMMSAEANPERDAETSAGTKFLNLFGDGYYEIPTSREKTVRQVGKNSALMYNFIHIPKTGGSFFNQVLKATERRLSQTTGSSAFPKDVSPFTTWATYPLVDTTKENFLDTRERFERRQPAEYFGVDRLREAYDSGVRMFTKGSYGMGLCELVDAPCAYFTVLREPVAQFLSHYKYSCLAGAENRRLWDENMKSKGSCDMDLLEWYDYLDGDTWLHLLAPGKGDDKNLQVETAIKNLEKSCFRYILTEKFEDGLEKMVSTMPDFKDLNIEAVNEHAKKNESPPLPDILQARFQAYIEDERMMNELRFRMKRPAAVYKHAKNMYERKWAQPMHSC